MSLSRWFFPLVAIGMVVGCSDDEETLQPLPEGTLSGLVTDSTGDPVAGAFINFEYTILAGDKVIWTPTGNDIFYPPEGPPAIVEIYDHQGRLLRTLETEGDTVSWDGLDSQGNLVPDGPYLYRLIPDDGETFDKWLMVVHESLSNRANSFVVRSGQDGTYSLFMSDLPIWKTYPGPTGGDITGDYTFGPEIAVYAFPGDGSTIHGRKLIEIGSPEIPVRVNLTIQ